MHWNKTKIYAVYISVRATRDRVMKSVFALEAFEKWMVAAAPKDNW